MMGFPMGSFSELVPFFKKISQPLSWAQSYSSLVQFLSSVVHQNQVKMQKATWYSLLARLYHCKMHITDSTHRLVQNEGTKLLKFWASDFRLQGWDIHISECLPIPPKKPLITSSKLIHIGGNVQHRPLPDLLVYYMQGIFCTGRERNSNMAPLLLPEVELSRIQLLTSTRTPIL